MTEEIDENIVSMKFNNKQFESGVATSMASLDKLKQSLQMTDATTGLDNLTRSANNFSLAKLGSSTDGISAKFIALSTIAITALANITNKAVDAGITIAKSLTLDPIKAGFDEYELKMRSIQTILANTARYGTTLEDVTKNLDALNEYSDKTIYNFGEMTKNIGLFTNAGIRIEDATAAIKGFSNEAAASGAGAQETAAAAYQLSQALSAGVVRLMDWKSLTNAGLGNANMKDGLIDVATAMGKFTGQADTAKLAATNFNASLEKEWLSADVMMNYLKIQAGELTDEQMRGLGLTAAQIKQLKKQAQTAEEAATKVRTFTQFASTIKESIASGWSETFSILIGDFNEATAFWTKVNNALGPVLTAPINALNDLLRKWDALGGRQALVDGITNAFHALQAVLKPVKDAFQAVFPPSSGKGLYNLTVLFREFTERLKIGAPIASAIKSVFTVFFTVLKAGFTIIRGGLGLIFKFFSIIGAGIGQLVQLAGDLANFIISLDLFGRAVDSVNGFLSQFGDVTVTILNPITDAIEQIGLALRALATGNPDQFFARLRLAVYALGPAINNLLAPFENLQSAYNQLITAFTTGDFVGGFLDEDSKIVDLVFDLREGLQGIIDKIPSLKNAFSWDSGNLPELTANVQGLSAAGDSAGSSWDRVVAVFKQVAGFVAPAAKKVGELLSTVFNKFIEWIKSLDFQDVLAIINTAFFIAFYRMLRQFLGSLDELTKSISGVFNQVTATLKTMQQDVKANIILKIAIAVGILVASLVALSSLKPQEIAIGLGALGIMVGVLVAAMGRLVKLDVSENAKLLSTAAAMVILTASIYILAQAVQTLGQMDVASLAKGLIAVGIILGALGLFAKFALVNAAGASAGAGLLLMAVAVNILAGAVYLLGNMKVDTLQQGLITVGLILAAMAGFSVIMSGSTGLVAGAVGLLIMTGALLVFAGVLQVYGSMNTGKIAKGLIAITASLIILGTAMAFMQGLMVGAAALGLAALAILAVSEAFETLGKMTDREIFRAIATMLAFSGILAILGVTAMFVAAPLALLAGALLVLGAAMLLAGTGMFLLATGFAILAAVGTAGSLVLATAFEGIIGLIPLFVQQLGLGLVALAVVIQDAGPQLIGAFSTVLGAMLQAIIDNAPKFGEALRTLIKEGIRTIKESIQEYIDAGWDILKAFVEGFRVHIPEMVDTVGDMIVDVINELSENLDDIIDAGAELIINLVWGIAQNTYRVVTEAGNACIAFLNGLTDWINENSDKLSDAGWDLAFAVVKGIGRGLAEGPQRLGGAVGRVVSSVLDNFDAGFDINSPSKEMYKRGKFVVAGLANGLEEGGKTLPTTISAISNNVLAAAEVMGGATVDRFNATMAEIADSVNTNMDSSPVITPVLDLTVLKAEAKRMDQLIPQQTFDAAVSYSQAANIVSAQAQQASSQLVTPPKPEPNVINFTQNNNSPISLSETEIYRQTKNQLSMAGNVL